MQSSIQHRLLLAAALLLAACGGKSDASGGGIPRERFVAANVAVRALPDSATPAERKAALKKAGVTERQLRAWVNLHARDPETLAKTWEEIAFKVDSVAGGPPPPPPSAGGPPPGAIPPPPMLKADTAVMRARRDSILANARRRDSLFGGGRAPDPPVPARPGPPVRRPSRTRQQ